MDTVTQFNESEIYSIAGENALNFVYETELLADNQRDDVFNIFKSQYEEQKQLIADQDAEREALATRYNEEYDVLEQSYVSEAEYTAQIDALQTEVDNLIQTREAEAYDAYVAGRDELIAGFNQEYDQLRIDEAAEKDAIDAAYNDAYNTYIADRTAIIDNSYAQEAALFARADVVSEILAGGEPVAQQIVDEAYAAAILEQDRLNAEQAIADDAAYQVYVAAHAELTTQNLDEATFAQLDAENYQVYIDQTDLNNATYNQMIQDVFDSVPTVEQVLEDARLFDLDSELNTLNTETTQALDQTEAVLNQAAEVRNTELEAVYVKYEQLFADHATDTAALLDQYDAGFDQTEAAVYGEGELEAYYSQINQLIAEREGADAAYNAARADIDARYNADLDDFYARSAAEFQDMLAARDAALEGLLGADAADALVAEYNDAYDAAYEALVGDATLFIKNAEVYSGTDGDDVIVGTDDQADVIIAKAGNDVLTGGAGTDLFAFGLNDGDNVITDFDDSDFIELLDIGLTREDLQIEAVAEGTLISFENTTVLLEGVEDYDGGSIFI